MYYPYLFTSNFSSSHRQWLKKYPELMANLMQFYRMWVACMVLLLASLLSFLWAITSISTNWESARELFPSKMDIWQDSKIYISENISNMLRMIGSKLYSVMKLTGKIVRLLIRHEVKLSNKLMLNIFLKEFRMLKKLSILSSKINKKPRFLWYNPIRYLK